MSPDRRGRAPVDHLRDLEVQGPGRAVEDVQVAGVGRGREREQDTSGMSHRSISPSSLSSVRFATSGVVNVPPPAQVHFTTGSKLLAPEFSTRSSHGWPGMPPSRPVPGQSSTLAVTSTVAVCAVYSINSSEVIAVSVALTLSLPDASRHTWRFALVEPSSHSNAYGGWPPRATALMSAQSPAHCTVTMSIVIFCLSST